MGYFWDGGLNTWFWHDDNANYGGTDPHVPGTPHNIGEFLIAAPAACWQMQNAIGQITKPNLVYLITENTIIGGRAGVDSQAQTTWTETASKYIFMMPPKTLAQRAIGALPFVRYNWGNKHGTNPMISGSRGVKIFQAASFAIVQDLYAYGSLIESDAGINLNDVLQNNVIEMGGCLLNGVTGQMGSVGTTISIYNTIWAGSGIALWTTVAPKDTDNLVCSLGGSPSSFIQSNSILRKLKGVSFIGTPTIAFVRLTNSAPAWVLSSNRWGDGEHVSCLNAVNVDGSGAAIELDEIRFRVHDADGEPLPNISVYMESDHQDFGNGSSYVPFGPPGLLTNAEGDIEWTDLQWTNQQNRIPFRAWGGLGAGVTVKTERVYTIRVNDPTDPAWDRRYPSVTFNLSGPGRDMKQEAPLALGGDFYRIITVPVCLGAVNWPDRWIEEQASI